MSPLAALKSGVGALAGVVFAVVNWIKRASAAFDAKLNAFVPLGRLSGKLLAIIIGLLVGALLGTLLALVGLVTESAPVTAVGSNAIVVAGVCSVVTGVLFLIVWPLDQRGIIRAAIVKSGIRQWSRASTGIVAAIIGIATASVVATAVGYLFALVTGRGTELADLSWRLVAFVFAVVWLLSTGVALYAFQRNNERFVRTDLTIVEVDDSDEDGPRELVVRNDSNDLVNFWKAKIEDTDDDRYQLDVDMTLRPGETGTFELPPDFSLETATYELPLGLDLFYDEEKVVSIYTRSGETFVLHWDEPDDVVEAEPESEPEPDPDPTPTQ